jgi:hypothetical protein
MRTRTLACAILGVIAALVAAAPPALAQRAQENAVKATFLTRFASFVDWPAAAFDSPDAPLVICVSGDAAVASLTEPAATAQRVNGRALVVRRVGAVGRGSGCHVLYVAGVEGQSVAAALIAVRGDPVLTVTDAQHARTRGSVHFVLSEGRVRFHIDRGGATAGGLSINSRLLNIALSVRG